METAIYDILEEVEGPSYDALLDFCGRHGRSCSLVVRQDDGERESIVRFLQTAQPHLLHVGSQSEWPGTRLSGHSAAVYRYRLSDDLVSLLKTRSRALFDWIAISSANRELPEDLAVYRADGSVLLGSTAQECEAWFEFTAEEYRQAADLPFRLSKRGA